MAVTRALVSLFILALWVVPVRGAGLGISKPDPNYLPPITLNTCCGYEISGKARSSQTINTAIRNLVLVVSGQSNVCNNHGTTFTPVNGTKIDNLNLYDGAIYVATDPLLGTNKDAVSLGPGNFALRLADKLVTANKFDRVILLMIGIGGTAVAEWDTGVGSGRFAVAYSRLAARGITPGLTNTTIAILWGQGENDTFLGTSQASYAASLGNVITQARNAGFTQGSVPFFVAKLSWNGGSTSANVQNAQTGIVNHGANIWAGPDADTLDNTKRQDNTHLNPTGADEFATLWQTALAAFGAPF